MLKQIRTWNGHIFVNSDTINIGDATNLGLIKGKNENTFYFYGKTFACKMADGSVFSHTGIVNDADILCMTLNKAANILYVGCGNYVNQFAIDYENKTFTALPVPYFASSRPFTSMRIDRENFMWFSCTFYGGWNGGYPYHGAVRIDLSNIINANPVVKELNWNETPEVSKTSALDVFCNFYVVDYNADATLCKYSRHPVTGMLSRDFKITNNDLKYTKDMKIDVYGNILCLTQDNSGISTLVKVRADNAQTIDKIALPAYSYNLATDTFNNVYYSTIWKTYKINGNTAGHLPFQAPQVFDENIGANYFNSDPFGFYLDGRFGCTGK